MLVMASSCPNIKLTCSVGIDTGIQNLILVPFWRGVCALFFLAGPFSRRTGVAAFPCCSVVASKAERKTRTDARPEHKGFNSVDRLHMRIMSLIPPTILLLAVQMVGFLWFLPLGSRHYVPNPWTETNSIFF